jgi:hypothetical protein
MVDFLTSFIHLENQMNKMGLIFHSEYIIIRDYFINECYISILEL